MRTDNNVNQERCECGAFSEVSTGDCTHETAKCKDCSKFLPASYQEKQRYVCPHCDSAVFSYSA